MFTGIIENLGVVQKITSDGTNKNFQIQSSIAKELKIDQSLAHNGVCLTVVRIIDDSYIVTAIKETLDKTNLGQLKVSDKINLERALTMEKRLDGHMVQGHVDSIAKCKKIIKEDGSWVFTFEVEDKFSNLMVEKGSICVSGTSLTLVNVLANEFSVAIIPYTFENTIFHTLKTGSIVNIEFDMMGKYIVKYLKGLNLK